MKHLSCTGVGRRSNNEDIILVENFNQNTSLFLITDGMGGYEKGAEAAKIISDNIATHLRMNATFNEIVINDSIKKANLALKQFNELNAIRSGATVAGIIINDNLAYCFWIGDVKIIYIKQNKPVWESKNHTLINELSEADPVRKKNLQERYGHVVTRSIAGKRENCYVDYFVIENVSDDEAFIICSDGVHNTMTTEHMILLTKDCNEISQIQFYLENHSEDNYSLIKIYK